GPRLPGEPPARPRAGPRRARRAGHAQAVRGDRREVLPRGGPVQAALRGEAAGGPVRAARGGAALEPLGAGPARRAAVGRVVPPEVQRAELREKPRMATKKHKKHKKHKRKML